VLVCFVPAGCLCVFVCCVADCAMYVCCVTASGLCVFFVLSDNWWFDVFVSLLCDGWFLCVFVLILCFL
jgi:hypothetical protein